MNTTPEKIPAPMAETSAKPTQAKKKPAAGDAPAPITTKGLNAISLRNDYYRDGFRTMKMAVMLQALVILLLGVVILFMINSKKVEYVYFATTEDGRLVKMSALAEPNLSTPALLSWSAQAVAQTMTFGYHDYRKRLQESSRFFTRPGWAKFTAALEGSGIVGRVEDNNQVVTAAPTAAPKIVQEGIVNGRYEWRLEIPMNITYRSGSKVHSESPIVMLKIVRVPRLENPNGIGIEQWLQ